MEETTDPKRGLMRFGPGESTKSATGRFRATGRRRERPRQSRKSLSLGGCGRFSLAEHSSAPRRASSNACPLGGTGS